MAGGQPPPAAPRVNVDAQTSVDFLKRIDAYAELHRKVERTLPELPKNPTPTQSDTHARNLARLIAQARPGAKEGDMFTRETRAYVRRQIARALAGPDGAAVRSSVSEENPGRVQLRVNARYPEGIPLTTMPPQILGALPKLPDDLEYRFIGERLILLDVHAQMIVDYIPDALLK
jgi:hypothetical protein